MAEPVGSSFTYQGELNDNGVAANGPYDMDFALWDALSEGGQIGATINLPDVPVVDGRFTVELDYGATAYDNSKRWLEIVVNSTTLLPRQPITSTPYSIQTRGIVVDENYNVGIGTSTPSSPLHVETDGGTAIYGRTQNLVLAYGGRFESDSTNGGGVFGWATDNDGNGFGVYGRSDGADGRGVYGKATASTGNNHGVVGESGSTTGRGVFGKATASSGSATGGFFESASTTGRGVVGLASASSGSATGGVFVSESTDGTGVFSHATANSGSTYGGYFLSNSGIGVYSSGSITGVIGDGSTGVYGSGFFTGVHGFAPNTGATGVYGEGGSFDFFAGGPGVDYGSSSSRRWKSNVVPIGDPLSKLAQLRGVYFDWDEEHGGGHDVGMIAEEVGAVIPEIVQYEENGVDAIGMEYSKLTPLLVEAVNALRIENDSLRHEVAAGKAHSQALEERLERIEAMLLESNIN